LELPRADVAKEGDIQSTVPPPSATLAIKRLLEKVGRDCEGKSTNTADPKRALLLKKSLLSTSVPSSKVKYNAPPSPPEMLLLLLLAPVVDAPFGVMDPAPPVLPTELPRKRFRKIVKLVVYDRHRAPPRSLAELPTNVDAPTWPLDWLPMKTAPQLDDDAKFPINEVL